MSSQKSNCPFPGLDFRALKRSVLRWVNAFPDIQRICLYHGNPDDDLTYVFLIQIPTSPNLYCPFLEKVGVNPLRHTEEGQKISDDELLKGALRACAIEEADLIAYYNWRQADCSHIHQKELQNFYKDTPPESYKNEWFWFEIKPGEDICEYELVDQADEKDFWVLYEKKEKKTKIRKDTERNLQVLNKARELKKVDPNLSKAAIYKHNAIIEIYGDQKKMPNKKYFMETILKHLNGT